MRHRPARPPLPARLAVAVSAWGPLLRRGLRVRAGRLLFGVVVITAVTALMLAVPVVSVRGSTASPVGLDASSSAAPRPAGDGSPVVMGEDGGPQRADGPGSAAPRHAAAPAQSGSVSSGTTSSGPSSAATPASGSSAASSTPDPTPAGPSTPEPSTAPSIAAGSIAAGSTAPGSIAAGPSAPRTSAAEQSPPEQILPAAPSAPSAADRVLALINQERARTGCDALSADDALAATAQAHSAAMRELGSLGHDDADGGSLSDLGGRAVAVARGDADPAAVVEGWLADPTDRAALLDCGLRSIGVGTADGDGGPWWTAVLA